MGEIHELYKLPRGQFINRPFFAIHQVFALSIDSVRSTSGGEGWGSSACRKRSAKGAWSFFLDAAFLLTIGSFLLTVELFYLQLTILGGRKTAQEKKQIPGNGGSQELFGPMFPWFCLFSLSFQWEEGQEFPGTLFLGTFVSYFRWFFSFRNFSFFTYNWSSFAYGFNSCTYSWSILAYSGKVHLIRALRDCKQRSLTVSKKAPTVSKKSFPRSFLATFRIIITGCTVTGRYGLGYASDMYPSPFWYVSDSLFDIEIQRKTLKTCTEHNVALDARART